MRVAAVVVAGGRGERFGGPKQFAVVDGETLAARSVSAARSVAEFVVLVVPEGYQGNGEGSDVVVTGGATRSASVRAGLAMTELFDAVLVHDAARPLASPSLFRAVVNGLTDGVDGVVPGVGVTDTIKQLRADRAGVVESTPARERLVAVQTPQAFRRSALVAAHQSSPDATDDAALVEALGMTVIVVPGERTNIKVTDAADLDRVAARGEVRT